MQWSQDLMLEMSQNIVKLISNIRNKVALILIKKKKTKLITNFIVKLR